MRIAAGVASAVVVRGAHLRDEPPRYDPRAGDTRISAPAAFVLFALYAVIVAPVTEEFVFRGLLYRSIRDRRGVAFGRDHLGDRCSGWCTSSPGGTWQDVLALQLTMVVTGVGLALIYERRRTWWRTSRATRRSTCSRWSRSRPAWGRHRARVLAVAGPCPAFPTDPWFQDLIDQINASQEYQDAAATWEGDVAFLVEAEPDKGMPEDVWGLLDLWHGACRGGGVVDAERGRPGRVRDPRAVLALEGGRPGRPGPDPRDDAGQAEGPRGSRHDRAVRARRRTNWCISPARSRPQFPDEA